MTSQIGEGNQIGERAENSGEHNVKQPHGDNVLNTKSSAEQHHQRAQVKAAWTLAINRITIRNLSAQYALRHVVVARRVAGFHMPEGAVEQHHSRADQKSNKRDGRSHVYPTKVSHSGHRL